MLSAIGYGIGTAAAIVAAALLITFAHQFAKRVLIQCHSPRKIKIKTHDHDAR